MIEPSGPAPWAVLTIDAPADAEEELAALLCEGGALGVETSTGLDGPVPAGRTILRAWFDAGAPLPLVEDLERLCPPARGARILSTLAVPDGRWVERWIASLDPFDVGGRFRVVPVVDADRAAPPAPPGSAAGRIPLRIVPGRAFGTGEHATTQLCLEALERIAPGPEGRRSLLDVGTGSGILAIAGMLLGFERALGIDVDPEAIAVARSNAGINPGAERLELRVGEVGSVPERFGVVTANLNAGILAGCLGQLVKAAAPGGFVVLSGLLEGEAGDFAAGAEAAGAASPRIDARDGWACVVAEAPGA